MIRVLFSGGVDSLVHLRWAMERGKVEAVYFDAGQRYAGREFEAASAICDSLDVDLRLRSLAHMREDPVTAQVELRNAFYILHAATLETPPDAVVFGMLKGEASPDKNPRFARRMQSLIRDSRAPSVYRDAQDFRLLTPFARHTKSQMVRWYTERFGTALLDLSVACYTSGPVMCGTCLSCFNRWLAWEANGLPPETYEAHPADAFIARVRAAWQDMDSRDGRALSAGRLLARREWTMECVRHVNAYAHRRHGTSAWRLVLG